MMVLLRAAQIKVSSAELSARGANVLMLNGEGAPSFERQSTHEFREKCHGQQLEPGDGRPERHGPLRFRRAAGGILRRRGARCRTRLEDVPRHAIELEGARLFPTSADRPYTQDKREVIQGACVWGTICNASAGMGKMVHDAYGVSPWSPVVARSLPLFSRAAVCGGC